MMLLRKSLVALALIAAGCMLSQAQVPEKPLKAAPIVDLAGVINNDSLTEVLNAQLDTLSKQTENQVVIVTVNDMGGIDPKEFATELGNKWGIGGAKLNNGMVMVIKPKNDKGKGQIGFAIGYGLEGALPDVFCKRLQVDYMLPHFKEGDYAGGIKAAVDEIVPVVLNEYNHMQALKDEKAAGKRTVSHWWIFIVIGLLLLFLLARRKKSAPAAPVQQPESTDGATESTATEGAQPVKEAAGVAAGAVASTAAAATQESEPEAEEENEDDDDSEPEQEKEEEKPKPYEYGYGGGNFGGGGASTEF